MSTLQDIAKRCGVSIQTASSILNKRGHLYREETQRKVLDAARELNYRPNVLARGLRGARTQTVGLIVPSLNSSSVSNEKLHSIERAARQRGYRLLVGTYEGDAGQLEGHVNDFLGLSVDGLVYMAGSVEDNTVLDQIIHAKHPIVVIEPAEEELPCSVVAIDRELGGYLQVRHLHDIGRRRVACLLTSFGSYKSQQKVTGIRRALAECGMTMDPDLCITHSTVMGEPSEVGIRMIRQLLDAGRKFDAVLTLSDGVALGAMTELVRSGVRIPEDVAIIGFDDDVFARYTVVPLTTIRQPRDIGDSVFELLLEQMGARRGASSPVAARQIVHKPRLVVRASTVANVQDISTSPRQQEQ